MKGKRMAALLCLLAAAFVACACSKSRADSPTPTQNPSVTAPVETVQPNPTEAVEEKEIATTVMIYMIGSDLESSGAAATEDILEMENSNPDLQNVRVILFTGGATTWHSEIPSDRNAILTLTEEGFEILETFPDRSMGEADTLTFFLDYAYKLNPEDRFELILWDHGNGPVMGYGNDRLHAGDALTLPELQSALANSAFATEKKLGFIGFDACLMASAELAVVLADYADYLIASQETEPSFGWDYSFLAAISQQDDLEISTNVVEKYLTYQEKYHLEHDFFNDEVTLSVLKLSEASKLEQTLNQLFLSVNKKLSGGFRSLIRNRVEVRNLGRVSTGSEYDLVDLTDLVQKMAKNFPTECAEVEAVLRNLVVVNGTNAEGCNGISLYYPFYNKNYYDFYWREDYKEINVLSDYVTFLDNYEKVWLGTSQQQAFAVAMEPSELSEQTFSLTLTKEQQENFAKAGYYVFERLGEDLYRAVYFGTQVSEEDGVLTARFDGNVIGWKDKFGRSGSVLFAESDAVGDYVFYTAYLMAQRGDLLHREYKNVDIQLMANQATQQVEVLAVYETGSSDDAMQTGKRECIDLSEWSILEAPKLTGRYLTRDENNAILPYFSWPSNRVYESDDIRLADEPEFVYQPLTYEGREFYVAFQVMDLQGNKYCSELLPMTVTQKEETEKVEQPAQEFSFGESNTCVIYDREGVAVTLAKMVDSSDGRPIFKVFVKNTTESKIGVYLEDILVDGEFSFSGRLFSIVEAGEEGACYEDDFCDFLYDAGVGIPTTIRFQLLVEDQTRAATLAYLEPMLVEVGGNADRLLFTPVLGVGAVDCSLEKNDEYSVRLLAFGGPVRLGSMSLYNNATNTTAPVITALEVWNFTKTEQTFELYSIRINGEEFLIGDRVTLAAQCKTVLYGEMLLGSLLRTIGEEITSMEIVLLDGANQERVYKVPLSVKREPMEVKLGTLAKDLLQTFTEEGVVLYSGHGVSAKMFAYRDTTRSQDRYGIRWENSHDFQFYATVESITFNNAFYLPLSTRLLLNSEGETSYLLNKELMRLLLSGEKNLASMNTQVRLKAANLIEESELVTISTESGRTRGVWMEPVFLAKAGEQTLYDRDELTLTLRGFGQVANGYRLEFPLCVKNHSEEAKKVKLIGLSCNGWYFSLSSGFATDIPSGTTMFAGASVSKSELESCGISEIAELKVLFSVQNVAEEEVDYVWYTVELSEKGTSESAKVKGTLLQSFEGVRIYLVNAEGSLWDENDVCWGILIENTLDRDIQIAAVYPTYDGAENGQNSLSVLSGTVGAHTCRYAKLNYEKKSAEDFAGQVEFQFMLQSIDGKSVLENAQNRVIIRYNRRTEE